MSGAGEEPGDPTETETETETGSTSADGDDDDGGPGIAFDLHGVPDSPEYDTSCGMVDFLFVIDNSGSMFDEQIALISNFPNFITGIENTLDSVDTIHVGVTTTDDYVFNVTDCQKLGSLVVKTGGSDSSNSICGPYIEDVNFMTEMDDLGAKFSCAAQVGSGGSAAERPMQAMVNAVGGLYGGVDECNEGFVRDEALLVIIIITDEPDLSSEGDPTTWYQDVVDAKAGIPENVVVVSLINTPGGICGWNDTAQSIADFTTMFGANGFMADVCLPDFSPIFAQAVEVIDVACDNFVVG
ncbi:hypothetical protein DB30_01806 [Enhygromyxa salina]|uniref:VWFA domain-containing protein n=1 Tax=Enhygromyxa salina TaxID=215803 RepID=A0A0C2CWJ3_9BACT|nr:vWA domain-containing protein [Enhygromyxa salina]KIG12202.1 hypothetical protein DB30_01806 [Enhygromyxa salina]